MFSLGKKILWALTLSLLTGCESPTRVAGGASETEATLAGLVLRPDGTPASGAMVRLRPTYFLTDTTGIALAKTGTLVRGDIVTNAKGIFRFDSVFLGNYTLEAIDGSAGGAHMEASIVGSQNHMQTDPLHIQPLSELKGHVIFPDSSKKAGYVRVYGLDRAVRIDSLGRFSLKGMPTGIFDLRLTPSSPAISPRTIRGVRLMPGTSLDLGDLSLAPSLNAEDYSAWGDSARVKINTNGLTQNLVNFPLLIRLDRSNFDFTASTGFDLRFANSRGRPLPYELERWDPILGKAEVWVNVDTLRSLDTAEYLTLYWNRPGASGRSDGSAVFDTALGYQGVWHLVRDQDQPAATFRDASDQGNDGQGEGLDRAGQATGVAFVGQDLDGITQSISTSKAFVGPNTFTLSLWFKTSTLAGGKLAGFGSYQTGLSQYFDRQLWMDIQGRIYFGVYPLKPGGTGVESGIRRNLSTPLPYNDGLWHQATARLSPDGQVLFIDGKAIATDAATTSGFPYSGFWRFGYDALGSWENAPSNAHFRGTIDEIRVTQQASSNDFIRFSFENQKPAGTMVSISR
jgi:protocatechuate 3,4-dioxygenase beta subunit